MKKTIGFIIILATMAFALFSWKSSFKEYNIRAKDEVLKSQILFKGLSHAVDFTRDDEDNYYIAFKNRIQRIDTMGRSYNVFTNNNLSISSLDYNNEVLYYASGKKVYSYN